MVPSSPSGFAMNNIRYFKKTLTYLSQILFDSVIDDIRTAPAEALAYANCLW